MSTEGSGLVDVSELFELSVLGSRVLGADAGLGVVPSDAVGAEESMGLKQLVSYIIGRAEHTVFLSKYRLGLFQLP